MDENTNLALRAKPACRDIWEALAESEGMSRGAYLSRQSTEMTQRHHVPPADPESHRIWVNPIQPSGVRVNHDIALTYAPFWAMVRVISETVAQLPWHIFRRTDTGQERQVQHTQERALNVESNPLTDAFTWRTVMLGWATTWGNAYAEIQRDRQGRPVAYWQIPPDRVSLVRADNGELLYEIRNVSGDPTLILPRDMLHVKGLGWDGQKGYSIVGYHAKTIGAGLGQNAFADGFIGGSAVPVGILRSTRKMSPQVKKAWRERFTKVHQGVNKKRELLVIDEGMDYQSIGIPPEDAQLLESRKFGVLDISRISGVAPHLLGEMEHATFSNIEEQNRDSSIRWIIPWSKRMNAPINTRVLGGAFFSQHILNALLRADVNTRFSAYATGIMNGFLSPDDVRRLEDMNPLPNGQGDVYVMQGQMTTLDNIKNPPEPQPVPKAPAGPPEGAEDDEEAQEPDDTRSDLAPNQRQGFVDLLGDVFRRACGRVHHRLVGNGPVDKILRDHGGYLLKELTGPAQSVYGAMAPDIDAETVATLVRMAAADFCERSQAELENQDEPAVVAEAWAGTRAQAAAADLFNDLRTVAYVRG